MGPASGPVRHTFFCVAFVHLLFLQNMECVCGIGFIQGAVPGESGSSETDVCSAE